MILFSKKFTKVLAVKTTVWPMWSPRWHPTSTRGLLETPVYMRLEAWIPETRLMTRGVWYGPISLSVLRDASVPEFWWIFGKNGLWLWLSHLQKKQTMCPRPRTGSLVFPDHVLISRKVYAKLTVALGNYWSPIYQTPLHDVLSEN